MDAANDSNDLGEDAGLAERLSNCFYAGEVGSRVSWAHRGRLSRLVAASVRPRRPAVLVLSLPRSGSSWVGSLLGRAPDALYLREPVSQSDPGINHLIVFDPADHPELDGPLRRLADNAFAGLPDFKDVVIHAPEQWSLRRRRRCRVVVKEVNPRACRWYLDRYRPRVIFLLRHPAAVSWSSQKQGWLPPLPDYWERRGREDGDSWSFAREALKYNPDGMFVTFESLCADPLGGFRRLYDFAGLRWTDAVADMVLANSRGSRAKIDAWRERADPECVAALRRGYNGSDAPWYRTDEEWSGLGAGRPEMRAAG